MIYENEVVMFLFGVGVAVYVRAYRNMVSYLPQWRILVSSFYILLFSWLMTIMESFILPTLLNLLEHLGYAGSAICLLVWCWRVLASNETTAA